MSRLFRSAVIWRSVIAILIVAVSSLAPLPAIAETIERYDVEIQVETGGAISVTETIAVTVEGDRIKRGIFRDIPLGSQGRAGFDVIEVLRNGKREPWSTESLSNGVRIRIGDADVMLPHQLQTYTIRYRMADQVGFSPDYDEIYWNATGNGWDFPIAQASALVILPPGAHVISTSVYTGPEGSTAQNAATSRDGDRVVRFTSTRRLEPHEGMTVAVAFPKGIVAEPGWSQRLLRGAFGRTALVGLGGLGLVFLYYLIAWARVGRDPAGGPIIARWESDLPPAAMRFLDRMRFDSMGFVAAVVSMAAKGWIAIEEDSGKDYTLLLRDDVPASARTPLSPGEQKVFNILFGRGGKLFHVKQSNRTVLQKAQAALKGHFENVYDRKFFQRNRAWFVPGIALSVVVWLVVAWQSAQPELALFMSAWLSGWTLGCAVLVYKAYVLWRDFLAGKGWKNLPGAIFLTLFSTPFLTGWIFGATQQVQAVGAIGLAILVLAILLNLVFFKLLEARTPLGRELVDEIEGMRLYLSVAEKDRLAFHHPPAQTPEHFEALLPYAVALGVEDKWAQQFERVFARITAETNRTYQPGWYHGGRFDPGDFGSFSRSLGHSVSAAAANPSSSGGASGGSFGGGSSGGGGGGGGGGGW